VILPETDPNDIFNPHLRDEALGAQEKGHGVFVWHGVDTFSMQDVEVLIILESRIGGLAIGDTVVACQVGEQGAHVVLAPKDPSKGRVLMDIDAEELTMNLERTGCEAFNDGQNAHVRLWDRLTGENILDLHGDMVHELVDEQKLNPKDYHSSAFKYAQESGAI
jgi:hypothetical protein